MIPYNLRRKVEKAAYLYLEMRGFKILEQNWGLSRNKINIIASKNDVIHFVEINYNSDENSHSAVEALTQTKLNQMLSAGEAWIATTKYTGRYTYYSIDIAGTDFIVLGFNEILQ